MYVAEDLVMLEKDTDRLSSAYGFPINDEIQVFSLHNIFVLKHIKFLIFRPSI